MRTILKPTLQLMSGRTVAFVGTFFVPVLLVRALDPVEFGTYKQLFLISTTLGIISQFGMGQSLYYFLPLSPVDSAKYTLNAVVFLVGAGFVCLCTLSVFRFSIAGWLNNPSIASYLIALGVLMMLTASASVLEIVAVASGRYRFASICYGSSDLLRSISILLPVVWTESLRWLLAGAIAFAALRLTVTVAHFVKTYGGALKPDLRLFKHQLGYAIPFGLAVVMEVVQANFHYYAVSHYFDAGLFAIYAVGCLQIPIVELVGGPASDVLMVRMSELVRDNRRIEIVEVWNDMIRKLSIVFIPATILLITLGRELILMLFTDSYAQSVPIFLVWSATVVLAAFPTEAVLRVYAQTRFILGLNALRLVLIVGSIGFFLDRFHLMGAVLVSLFVAFFTKVLSLARIGRLMNVAFSKLLPWESLARITVAAIGAAVTVLVFKQVWPLPSILMIAGAGVLYLAVYVALLGDSRRTVVEELCVASQER